MFHYTSDAAFRSIVGSETFWFTSIYHMDDTEELTYAFGVAQTVLREAAESGDALTKMFCEELTDVEDIEKIKKIFGFYSVSFGVRDDPKQWGDYADKSRGVSFGLSPEFFKIVAKKNPSPEEITFLGKVVYGDKDARERHRAPIDSAIATIQAAQKAGSIKDGKDGQIFFQHMAAEMTVETLWNSVTTKEARWGHPNSSITREYFGRLGHLDASNPANGMRVTLSWETMPQMVGTHEWWNWGTTTAPRTGVYGYVYPVEMGEEYATPISLSIKLGTDKNGEALFEQIFLRSKMSGSDPLFIDAKITTLPIHDTWIGLVSQYTIEHRWRG